MRYAAVVCPHCGKASAAKLEAKRHQCPYCGRWFATEGAVLAVGSAKEVRAAVIRHNTGGGKAGG